MRRNIFLCRNDCLIPLAEAMDVRWGQLPVSIRFKNRAAETGGFDVVIEAVGLPSTFQASIDCRGIWRSGGADRSEQASLDFNFTVIQKKELNIYGSRNA
jgi:threonine dehydrogenase-like Zn-dependent dehydrogenase